MTNDSHSSLNLNDRVLFLLQQHPGTYVSGEQIAEALGVSRTSVWKAVETLRSLEYPVVSGHRKGYKLNSIDTLSKAGLCLQLGDGYDPSLLHVHQCVDSTNTLLRTLAQQGAPSETVVVAGRQTAGKGRRGRPFFSPERTGIYLSLLLRPDSSTLDGSMITGAAAVAVAQSIDALNVVSEEAQIKWVNDVYVARRKVCGILTEGMVDMESGQPEYAVVGIGVNIYAPEEGFPTEFAERAGWISDTHIPEVRNRLAAGIIQRFYTICRQSSHAFVDEYIRRSFVVGHAIDVISASGTRSAQAIAIDTQLGLHVRYDNGTDDVLHSGEVSIRPHERVLR